MSGELDGARFEVAVRALLSSGLMAVCSLDDDRKIRAADRAAFSLVAVGIIKSESEAQVRQLLVDLNFASDPLMRENSIGVDIEGVAMQAETGLVSSGVSMAAQKNDGEVRPSLQKPWVNVTWPVIRG